jgi:DNA-binding CsgD family transcriptional regulator
MPSTQLNGQDQIPTDGAGRQVVSGELPDLLEFHRSVDASRSADGVLDALQRAASTLCAPLSVLAAVRLPIKSNDWSAIQLGKSVFLHPDVPHGWWSEYTALAPTRFAPALHLARSSLASFTWTESMRLLEPIGIDRWSVELGYKHGMRDGFICPVGGRWMVAYWSKRDISTVLTPSARILLQATSSLAAQRLEQLTALDVQRIGTRSRLTAREVAVLRLVSNGEQASEIAGSLGIGEETVRSHLKKAQTKLGVRNRAQAACEALRQNLIP